MTRFSRSAPAKPGRRAGQHARYPRPFRHRHFARVHLQYSFATLDIGSRHDNAPIEPSRAQQRGIQNIGTVGRGDENDPFVGFEAVHFDEQLVQCLLALVMAAAETGAAMAPNGVDFVNEDDAGRILLALNEIDRGLAKRRRRRTFRRSPIR